MTQTCPSRDTYDLLADFLVLKTEMTKEQALYAVDFMHNRRPGKGYTTQTNITPDGVSVCIRLDLGDLDADEAKQIESLFLNDMAETVGTLQHWLPIYRHNRGKGSKVNVPDTDGEPLGG